MTRSKAARWGLIVLIALAVLAAAVLLAYQFAARTLKDKVLSILGPESSVEAIHVRATSVEILGARIGAPKGWPAKETLAARRILIVPDLRQLMSRRMVIQTIEIYDAHLPVVREKDGLKVLPTLVNRSKEDSSETHHVSIGTVRLENCVLDLYDETVHLAAGRIRLDRVAGTLRDIEVPELDKHISIALDASTKGPEHTGTMKLNGWIDVAAKSSELALTVRSVDLASVEAYVLTATKSGIEAGTFDLDLKASVKNSELQAPGTLSLHSMKLKSGGISSIPREVLVGALADKEDTITIHFLLHGDVKKPEFSLNESMTLRLVTSLGKILGLSVEGLLRLILLLMQGLGSSIGGVLGGG